MHVKENEVFIFKAQVEDSDNEDPYAKLLRESGFFCKVICVLEFKYCNENILRESLMKPQNFSGIIFTSPRAVQAISSCLNPCTTLPPKWRELPMFVVGEKTKSLLWSELGLEGQKGDPENAQGLAELITKGKYAHPLLFPCSDLRRESLPDILTKENIAFVEIVAYCTVKHPLLEQNLMQYTENATLIPEYMVFFSPSGVKYCIPELSKKDVPLDKIKFVAIGPVTADALIDIQLPVWSYALKPSPQQLLEAVERKTTQM